MAQSLTIHEAKCERAKPRRPRGGGGGRSFRTAVAEGASRKVKGHYDNAKFTHEDSMAGDRVQWPLGSSNHDGLVPVRSRLAHCPIVRPRLAARPTASVQRGQSSSIRAGARAAPPGSRRRSGAIPQRSRSDLGRFRAICAVPIDPARPDAIPAVRGEAAPVIQLANLFFQLNYH
jgi:hypothetical protein